MVSKRNREGLTLGDELENLERVYPNKRGLRLRAVGERIKRLASAATLHTYLESDSRGKHYALHETVFAKRERKSERWWASFFNRYVFNGWKPSGTSVQREGIINGGVVPSVNIRTRKQWRVRAFIGYHLHDNRRIVHSSLHSRRHKA